MKKTALILGILLFAQVIAATTVELEADRDELGINETIELHLEIDIEKPIGGRLEVYREIEPNRFAAKVLYNKASPAQCSKCVGGTPLYEDLSRNFYFTPEYAGNYYAEANFDGIRKRVNFTVAALTLTTTSTSTSSTTTTSTSTSTSTTSSTTTTLPQQKHESVLDSLLGFLYGLIKSWI